MIRLCEAQMRYLQPRNLQQTLLRPWKPAERVLALRDVTLTVEDGDRLAILGPNGAGKTTLLKLISGLLLPSSGTIEVCGHNTATHNLLARASVGMVMNEERSFFWRLTGRQNLHFFGTLDNLTSDDLTPKVDRLLQLVGLEDSAEKTVSAYSSGMRQRLAIARGLLADPRILILDEPTRTLDPLGREEMTELIRTLLDEEQKTLLIATHRLEEVELLCNKVLVVNKGEVIDFEPLTEILASHASLLDYYRACMS